MRKNSASPECLGSGEADRSPLESADAGQQPRASDGSTPAELPSFEELASFAEARLRDTLAQIEALRQSAQAGRARLAAELQVQRRRASTAEQRLRQIEGALLQAQEASEDQRITCAELTTVLRAAEHRLSALEKALVLKDQELAALRQNYDGEIEHARSQLVMAETQLGAARQEISDLRERAKTALDEALQQRSALQGRVEDLEQRLSRQAREGESLAEELHRVRESVTATHEAKSGGDSETRGARASAIRSSRVADLEAVVAAARERERALVDELRQQRAAVEDLKEQLVRREERSRESEQGVEQIAAELRERSGESEALRAQREELQLLVRVRSEEVDALRSEVADAVAQQQEWAQERTALEARVAELDKALVSLRENETLLQGGVSELQQRLQKEQANAEIVHAELQSQIRLRESLESEVLEARARATKLEAQRHADAQNHMMQLAKSTDRCRALEAERDVLQEQTVSLLAQRERLERECEQLRRRAETEKQKAEMARLQARLEEVELRHPSARRARTEGSGAPAGPAGTSIPMLESAAHAPIARDFAVVAVGASTGGPAALGAILPLFAADTGACFVIVQHMPPGYTAELASMLDQQTKMTVREAREGDLLRPGTVLIAPGGHHMEIRAGAVQLSVTPPVNKHRPSVDVLFESLISVAPRVYAVLLSGMGSDGVSGMRRLRAAGAKTIVQDEATCVVWGMPGAAVKAGCADRQLAPLEIGRYLVSQVERARGADESVAHPEEMAGEAIG